MSLTLAQLIARRVSPEWWEAVALVQGACVAARQQAAEGEPAIPDPDAILLTSDGIVALTGAAPRERRAPVGAALALLDSLLADTIAPAPLRLLIATARSSPAQFASLEQLSDALEYYERPDRRGVLAVLYERALRHPEPDPDPVPTVPAPNDAAPSVSSAGPRLTDVADAAPSMAAGELGLDDFPSELDPPPAPAWQALAARTRKSAGRGWAAGLGPRMAAWRRTARDAGRRSDTQRLVVATAGLVVVALSGGSWWLWANAAGSSPVPPLPSTAMTSIVAAPSSMPASLHPEVAPQAPAPGPLEPANTRLARPAATRSALHAAAPAPLPSRLDPAATAATTEASDSLPGPVSSPAFSAAPAPRDKGQPAKASALPVDEVIYLGLDAGDPGRSGPTGPVYSVDDAGVRRPVGINRRFWYEPPEGIGREQLTQVELLISARGEVLGAKAVAGPRSYFDGMVLSAIKAWKFQPATRHGLPVACRIRVFVKID